MKTKIALLIAVCISTVTFSQKQWTLKECVEHALENNITVKQNRLNLEASKVEVKSAKGNFLPSLNASTGGNLSFGTSFDQVTRNRVTTSLYGGSLGINSGITIFNGYRNLNTFKQATLGVEGAKLDLEVIENDIALRVVNTYLNVLFAKENLEVAKIQSNISQNQINRAKAQFEAGAIPKGDFLNVQSTAANDLQGVVRNENSLNLALLNLSQLLQISHKGFDIQKIDVDAPSVAMLYEDADVVYQKALGKRPEIKRAKLNIKNADLGVEIAKSGYLPSVSASGSVSTNYGFNLDLPTGVSNTNFFTQLNNNLGYGLGFNVSIPIFNGFKNDANVERAEVNKEIIETRLLSQQLQLQQRIEQAFLDAKAASKTYEVAKVSLQAQREAFKNAQASYDYGAMTLFDFDQVRNRLVNAEAAMIRGKYDYVFKTKVLKFFYGENILD